MTNAADTMRLLAGAIGNIVGGAATAGGSIRSVAICATILLSGRRQPVVEMVGLFPSALDPLIDAARHDINLRHAEPIAMHIAEPEVCGHVACSGRLLEPADRGGIVAVDGRFPLGGGPLKNFL